MSRKDRPNSRPENRTQQVAELRQRAEAAFSAHTGLTPENIEPLSAETLQQTLHNLRVHQIELEIQNESLRESRVALEAAQARYSDLFNLAPVGYCTISEAGTIIEANATAARQLGARCDELPQQAFSRFVCKEDQDFYYLLRKKLLASGQPQSCDLRVANPAGTPFWARLDAVAAPDENGATALLIVLTDISESKQAAEQLREMAASLETKVNDRTRQLRALTAQLALTEERERRMLAQDLHDNLGQLLALIKIKLTTPGASAPQPSIKPIVALLGQAEQAVRTITLQLSPPILQITGFVSALEWLSEEMRRIYGLTVRLNLECCSMPLVYEVQLVLYRCIRELLINVTRHAKVSESSLSCRCNGSWLLLTVSDDGCGFDHAHFRDALPGSHHFGLDSVIERIANLGGSVEIDSSPDQGTLICLAVPCSIAAPECPRS